MESHLTPAELDKYGIVSIQAIGVPYLSQVGSVSSSSSTYYHDEEIEPYKQFKTDLWEEYVGVFQSRAGNFAIHDASQHHCPVIFYSRGLKKLLGLKRREILGQNILLRSLKENGNVAANMLRQSIYDGTESSGIIEQFKRNDGTHFDNLVYVYPLRTNLANSKLALTQHCDYVSVIASMKYRFGEEASESEEVEISMSETQLLYMDPPLVRAYLEWHDVKLEVPVPVSQQSKNPFKKTKMTKRVLLEHVSGYALPGEMLAIMGPSGSGKSTLLNVLSGRKEIGVTGSILVNGKERDHNFKRRVAYVLQDDILFPILTVYETFLYQARTRMPSEMSIKDKKERVEKMIQMLNLEKARNTIIGNQFIRGISGGERKRVNIGAQLLSFPSIVFLDEPTSGLDTSTAFRLMNSLRAITSSGYNVVCTIHQPSQQVFALFDKLLMMIDGRIVYNADAKKALEYFESIGLPAPSHTNPADFVMSLILKEEMKRNSERPLKAQMIQAWEGKETSVEPPDDRILAVYRKEEEATPLPQYLASYIEQFLVLSNRSLRMGIGTYFQPLPIFQTIFVALLSGFVWLQLPADELTNKSGAIFFTILYAGGFTPLLNVLYNFPLERPIILRERSEGAYPLSSYYLAKVLSEAPFEQIYPLVFLLITYWMIGYDPSFTSFLLFWVIIIFLTWASSGLGLMIGASIYNVKTASTLATVIILSFVLSAGFYVSILQIPVWIRWLQYLSFFKYAYDALILVEFTPAERALAGFNIIVSNYGANLGILIGFAIVFRIFAYILLKIFFKAKK